MKEILKGLLANIILNNVGTMFIIIAIFLDLVGTVRAIKELSRIQVTDTRLKENLYYQLLEKATLVLLFFIGEIVYLVFSVMALI